MDTDQVHERRVGRREMMVVGAAVVLATLGTVAFLTLRSDGPAVITLASTPGGERMATAEADDAAAPVADTMLWDPVERRFELRDPARFDAGEATAWQLRAPGDREAAARELAAHFGLDDVRPAPYDDASLIAGAEDGSGPTLYVGPAGDWYYSAPGEMVAWDCVEPEMAEDIAADRDAAAAAEPSDVDEAVPAPDVAVPACDPPTPPSGVPSADEARRSAASLFEDLGVPGELVITSAESDDWGAWVQGSVLLDGVEADLFVYANWGGDAQLMSAGGTLATPTRMDTYPTIDADRAVARLEEQMNGWANGGHTRPMPLPADAGTMESPLAEVDEPVEDAGATDGDVAADPDQPVSSDDLPTDDPLVTTPVPAPDGELEVVTVTLVEAEPVLMLQADADGTMWLLPGYRFTDADGGIWQVLAIGDEYVETEEPAPIDPEPTEPQPGEPSQGGAEPAPGGGVDPEPGGSSPGSAGEGGQSGVTDPGVDDGEPGGTPAVEPELQRAVEAVIGMTEQDATALVEAAGGEVRVVARDGEHFAVTDDFRTDRVNLTVADGVVTEASLG